MKYERLENLAIALVAMGTVAVTGALTLSCAWLFIGLGAQLLAPVAFAQTKPAVELEAAIAKEQVDGDLKTAMAAFQKIAANSSASRDVRAKALLHLAGCYEKQGQQQAQKVYEQVVREFSDQPEQAAMARQRLAAINGAGTAKTGGESAHRIPVPTSASLVQSDGRHVFYVDRAAGGLMVAQMDGSNSRVIFRLADRSSSIPSGPQISPDGKQAAFRLSTPDDHSYCVVGVDGSGFRELHRITSSVEPVGGWSPDGRMIIAHPHEADGLYSLATINVQDGSLHKINNDPSGRGEFALAARGEFSPDGKYIIFAVGPTSGLQSDIRIVAADGSYQGKLVEHPSWNNPLGFAPDGKHFLFQSDRSGQPGIYAIPVAGGKVQGEPVLIKKLAAVSTLGTSLSRNGTFFYTVGEGDHGAHESFTLNLDPATGKTAGSPQLLSGPAGFIPESAAWSSDGERLALISGKYHEHGGGEVMLTVRKLASGQDAEWKIPSETSAVVGWAADGSEVYTAVQRTGAGLLELHGTSATTGESRTLSVIPRARVVYCVRPAAEGNALLISYGQQPPTPGRPAGLIRQDLQTGQQTEIVPQGVVSEITMSPDGKQLAAFDRQPKSASVMAKPLVGGDWKTLATLEGSGYLYLHWLPNGDLLFGQEGLPDSSIFRLPASGGAPQKVAELKSLEHVHEIRVSPDGRQLLFQSYVNNLEFWALENFLPKEFMQP
ncbi:MAG: hypothetical protein ACLQU1_07320 [Bryobacteraceae bacterium]